MRKDLDAVWVPWQNELLENQERVEAEALALYKQGMQKKTVDFLTEYTMRWGNRVVEKAWELGDDLWTRYDELF
jgi:hypothetical protein